MDIVARQDQTTDTCNADGIAETIAEHIERVAEHDALVREARTGVAAADAALDTATARLQTAVRERDRAIGAFETLVALNPDPDPR